MIIKKTSDMKNHEQLSEFHSFNVHKHNCHAVGERI